jgi:phosphate butyryltransferase
MITRVEEVLCLAKKTGKRYRMVVAGAESRSALETVNAALQEGLVQSILVGDAANIRRIAEELEIDLRPFPIHDIPDPQEAMNRSCELVAAGSADFLFKGSVSTRIFLKGVLNRAYGFRTDRILSHVGVFNVPGEQRIMIITDAGVNVQPDLNKKMHILLNAVDLAHILGNPRPRVAMLSFVEEATDPNIRSTAEADSIAEMYRTGQIPDCVVEGPYSLDVALSVEAARIKGVKGEVAGRADVIVMHDIGMGNVLYKALMMWCNPTLASVVMGAKIPLVVTSRADSMNTKLNSIALGIVTAESRVAVSSRRERQAQ